MCVDSAADVLAQVEAAPTHAAVPHRWHRARAGQPGRNDGGHRARNLSQAHIERMTDTTKEADALPVSMDTKTAAAWLAVEAPIKTAEQWVIWLHNNRVSSRNAGWQMPYAKLFSRVRYETEDLQRLARLSNVAAGKEKVNPDDAAWMKSLSTKNQPNA